MVFSTVVKDVALLVSVVMVGGVVDDSVEGDSMVQLDSVALDSDVVNDSVMVETHGVPETVGVANMVLEIMVDLSRVGGANLMLESNMVDCAVLLGAVRLGSTVVRDPVDDAALPSSVMLSGDVWSDSVMPKALMIAGTVVLKSSRDGHVTHDSGLAVNAVWIVAALLVFSVVFGPVVFENAVLHVSLLQVSDVEPGSAVFARVVLVDPVAL